jgi:hypothetical protein
MISLDGHRFTKHVIASCMQHHCKTFAVTLVHVIPDVTSLDWKVLIPATICEQSDNMVVVVYNKLWSSEEELLAESKSFADYEKNLPLVSQYLLYQVRFVPGSECTLWECLHENRKLHAASDRSLDQDAELASHSWHLICKWQCLGSGCWSS